VSSHGRIDEYLDGVLADAAMDEFLTHLADCPACQAELHAAIQLRDREDALRAEVGAPPAALDVKDAAVEDAPVEEAGGGARRPAERPAPVVSLAARRRRVVALVIAGAALAAAVALVILPRGRGGARERAAAAGSSSALALAPTRGLEARLAWSGAADYRRYDADRAGGVRLEAIDPRAIAALAERGDCAGVAAAYLLTGELARAGVQYDRCPGGPDLDADRAALALARGAAAEALALADRALGAQPEHAVARWNRALALRDLGLGLTAAAAFERAAVDPAWSAEARARAAAARAPQGALRTGYAEVVAAGRAMVAGGPPISPALARAFPARARLRLDDAIRVAPTRARLDELRPLATALDGLAGDGLVARLERAQPIAAPPSVVATYVAWVTRGAVDDVAAWRRWRRDAARAGATSLLVGTLLLSGLGADDPALVAEAAGDPWTAALAEVHAAAAEADPAKTDARLTAVEDACARRALPDYPCLRAALERATFESARYRPPTSAAAAAAALARIATTGEWAVRWRALYLAGNAARLRGESSLAVAYYDETALASDDCPTQRVAVAMTAAMAVEAGRFAEAAARARTRPACGAPNLFEANLEVDLARAGVPVRPTAELLAELTALAPDDPYDLTAARYQSARLRLGTDPIAADELRDLASAGDRPVEPGRPDPGQLAAAVLAVEAGRAARWDDAVAAVATWQRSPAPARCGLVLAGELARTVAVAIGPTGARVGALVDGGAPGAVPPAVAAALGGCDRVDVAALPPHLGVALALDPALPWRFVTGPARAAAVGPAHRVVVADARPPSALGLAPLTAPAATPPGAEIIRGDAATVARVAAAARDATLLEFHVHAARVADSDAPALALTDGPGGWAATAEVIAGWSLARAPVVVLADCEAGVAANYGELYWGLPRAFLSAGASVVIAALVPVPDAEAGAVFAAIGDAIAGGEAPAAAVARLRAEKIRQDPTSWMRHVVVFE
jgi:hypothetical protein